MDEARDTTLEPSDVEFAVTKAAIRAQEAQDLTKLAIRVLCDTAPPRPDAIYLFTELPENMGSCYAAALDALKRFPRIVVLLSGEDGSRCPGVAGFDESRERLVALGAPAASIEEVPFEVGERLIHTKNESDFLATHCRRRSFYNVLIAAPPIHAVRAFATACTSAMALAPTMRCYCVPGPADPWEAVVTHSQGKVRDSRVALLDGELDRVSAYTKKGDIAKAADILAYLAKRDKAARADAAAAAKAPQKPAPPKTRDRVLSPRPASTERTLTPRTK